MHPPANHSFIVTRMARARAPPFAVGAGIDVAERLRDVVSMTIALASQVSATLVLHLEDKYGPYLVRMRDPEYKARMANGPETSVVALAIRETVDVLKQLLDDAETLRPFGMELVGDDMKGRFIGKYGIIELLEGVYDYISASSPLEVAEAACDMIDASFAAGARRNRFTRHEKGARRAIVDTAKQELETSKPNVKMEDVSLRIQNISGIPGALADALAIQAALEAGFYPIGDVRLASLGRSIGPGNDVGVLITPVPLPRVINQEFLPLMAVRDGVLIRGVATGDRWVRMVSARDVGSDTVGEYAAAAVTDVDTDLTAEWSERPVIQKLDGVAIDMLYAVLMGNVEAFSELYRNLKACAVSCGLPGGMCTGRAWLKAIEMLGRNKDGFSHDLAKGHLNHGLVVAIYAGSEGYLSFCRGICARVVGAFDLSAGELIRDDIKWSFEVHRSRVSVTSSRNGTLMTGVCDWRSNKELSGFFEILSLVCRQGSLTLVVDGVSVHPGEVAPMAKLPEFVSRSGATSHLLWSRECAHVTYESFPPSPQRR